MMARGLAWIAVTTLLSAPAGVSAYPGGTPDFQTDVAPFCAACHSSLTVESLEGTGERADKELSANKHLVFQTSFAELSCRAPDVHKDVVGVGISNFEAHLAKSTDDHVANLGVLLYFPCNVLFVFQCC